MRFTLLSREYCHLCHEMLEALRPLQQRHGFEVEVVDVDRDPALEAKWGDLVPVLLDGNLEVCHYHLDADAVDARMAHIK